jgi:hypothetical protein
MSTDQQWEVYSVDTGETLEIVTGRNKNEAAEVVFDKYANQGIGFNVRPYQDPATMTPRAKLAKRITSQPRKSVDYNYEIVNQADVRLPVVDKFYATNDTDAQKVYSQWLKNKDLPDDTADYGYRKVSAKPAEEPPWVAQNFDSARDSATLQANLQDRSPQTESIDPISGAGAIPPRQDPKSISKKAVTPVAKAQQDTVSGLPYRSAIGQAISKRDLEDMTQQIKMARQLGDSVMEMEETPPAVLHALDRAAQKNGYKNWADVKTNPRSPQAVMTVAKLANTMLRLHQSSHDKMFETAKSTTL